MATLARKFGIIDDATAGGQDYDALAGAIPDASIWYPPTGGTFDPGLTEIDRNDEVRGRRANQAPIAFRSDPSMVVPIAAYPKIVEKLTYKLLGSVTTSGGTAPTPYTHAMKAVQFGTINLPALHAQLVRDDLNVKMGGCSINRITYDFPFDGEGTIEVELFGKWFSEFAGVGPAVTMTGLEDTMMLRDAEMFIDGSGTAVPDLQGFSLTFSNNLTRKPYAGRNIQARTLGTPAKVHKLWFPAENKVAAAPEVTFSMNFGSPVVAQEVAMWFRQSQKLVVECTGVPLGGAFTGDEMLRFTLFRAVSTGGGVEALTARDDITQALDGGVFWSETDSNDLLIESISTEATLT